MATPAEYRAMQQEARRALDVAAHALRLRLAMNDVRELDWKPTHNGAEWKIGRGRLYLRHPVPTYKGYPGITYVSSMGANSDDSYTGFLPGVTFDEAKLLVYKEWKRETKGHAHDQST